MNEKRYPSVMFTRLVMADKDMNEKVPVGYVYEISHVMADKDMNEKVPVGYVYEISHG